MAMIANSAGFSSSTAFLVALLLLAQQGFAQLPPVETLPALGKDLKPAFAGQTRVASIKSKTEVTITPIVSGLVSPWGLDFFDDGRMIVSERPGSIRVVARDILQEPIQGVPPVLLKGDAGMYDVKLDPNFKKTRWVFWTFVEPVEGGSVTSVARARLSNDEKKFEDLTIIYRTSPAYTGTNHNGSRMIFDKKGNLFVSFGEKSDDEIRKKSQDLSSSLGKIIRVNKEGKAVKGNPFEKTPGALPEIWTYGHRNPQGFAFHPETGELWATDHGPNAGDELNIINAGLNYGWPVISYGIEYSGKLVNNGLTKNDGMEQPIYFWDPSVAPGGMMFYTGRAIPEWRGSLFIAALRGSHVIRLVIQNNKVVGEERLFADLHKRFRHVVQGPDQAIYAIIDDKDGKIFRISK